ncbi:MAG: DUF3413 domain-containing protein [Steroidobacter sp.]
MAPFNLSVSTLRQLLRWWGWLLAATTALGLLIATRYYIATDLDAAPFTLLFRGVMLLAHFGTLSALLLSPLLLLIVLAPRPAMVIPLGAACSALILGALLVDTQVYLLYRFHINAGVLNLLLGGAARETFVFPGVMYVQAAGAALALLVVQAAVAYLCWRVVQAQPRRSAITRAYAAGLIAAIAGFHVTHIWADAAAFEPLLEQTDVLPLRYAATAKRALRHLGVQVSSDPAFASSARQDRNGLAYPLRPVKCGTTAAAPNIIVIMIDSWRFDALSAGVTPNIERFARRSVRFEDHYSGGNATRIGVFSFFYSIPGTYWHRMLAERQGPVFIEQLLQQGYDARVFRSAPLFSPEFDRTVFARLDSVRMRSEGAGPADWDRDLTDDFVSFLDSRSNASPFFAFLFYDSPHTFQLPGDYPLAFQPSAEHVNYFTLNEGAEAQAIVNRYLNSVHYVDSLVGEALDAIEARGLLDNSVIVITGDHGQEFNDNGRKYWGHGSNFTRYQTGVPLVLYAPELAPTVEQHRTTHFDVMPTLMSKYLGCAAPFSDYSVGRSLFEAGGRETVLMSEYTDFAIVQPDLIAVVRRQGMDVLSPEYAEIEGGVLAPEAIRLALEQRSRFYKSAPLSSP